MRKRSKFSLSHYHLTTAEMGTLFPVSLIDVLPGDSIQQVSNVFMRMSPMLAPVMHPIQIRLHHWFVPYRLIWDDFEDFITGGPRGVSTPEFPTIQITGAYAKKGSLYDYFRLPVINGSVADFNISVSALPFRAYALIWNNFYRDQDLQDEIPINYGSGVESQLNGDPYPLQRVSWKKDYFTTARPWTQKGVEVTVPITPDNGRSFYYKGRIRVSVANDQAGSPGSTQLCQWITDNVTLDVLKPIIKRGLVGDLIPIEVAGLDVVVTILSANEVVANQSTASVTQASCSFADRMAVALYDYQSEMINGQGSVDIRDLRLASALQRFEEARAKYGSRYNEFLMYLGVTPQDARLQLPEYLGGGKQIMQISEVLQTAEGQDSGVGTMRGHGLSAGRTRRYRRFIPEHGVIMTLMSVLPDPIYMQGVNRMWLKRVKEDFYHHELANIGMQEVYQQELYAPFTQVTSGLPPQNTIFGYQERYDEYRHAHSGVSGDFRDTLDYWHLARKFDAAPVLNGSFIQANPTKRIFAEQTTHPLWIMVQHSIQARRMMSKRAKTKLQ